MFSGQLTRPKAEPAVLTTALDFHAVNQRWTSEAMAPMMPTVATGLSGLIALVKVIRDS